MSFEIVIPATHAEKFLGVLPRQAKLLLIAPTSVKAGIDLNGATLEGLVLNLPSPKILYTKVKVEDVRVFDYVEDALIAQNVAPELQVKAQNEALEKAVTTACQGKILEQAQMRSQRYFTDLLEGSGITVTTSAIGECSKPAI